MQWDRIQELSQLTGLGRHRHSVVCRRLRLKRDGPRAKTRFRLSTKRTSPFKSAGASFQSTTGSRSVCISGSNAGYTMFGSSRAGPQPVPQRVLHRVRSSAPSFILQYPLFSVRSPNRCLRLFLLVLVPSVFPSVTCF